MPDEHIRQFQKLLPLFIYSALVAGLWVLAVCPTCRNFALYLFLAAIGGQYSDFAAALITRWRILDARDQSMTGEAIASQVEERPDAGGSADPDLSKIF